MTASQKTTEFEGVVQKLDPHSKLLRTWTLKGGVSAQVRKENEVCAFCVRAWVLPSHSRHS